MIIIIKSLHFRLFPSSFYFTYVAVVSYFAEKNIDSFKLVHLTTVLCFGCVESFCLVMICYVFLFDNNNDIIISTYILKQILTFKGYLQWRSIFLNSGDSLGTPISHLSNFLIKSRFGARWTVTSRGQRRCKRNMKILRKLFSYR